MNLIALVTLLLAVSPDAGVPLPDAGVTTASQNEQQVYGALGGIQVYLQAYNVHLTYPSVFSSADFRFTVALADFNDGTGVTGHIFFVDRKGKIRLNPDVLSYDVSKDREERAVRDRLYQMVLTAVASEKQRGVEWIVTGALFTDDSATAVLLSTIDKVPVAHILVLRGGLYRVVGMDLYQIEYPKR